ncbi:MAG: SDR family NAD(P)-dependent oxidoreductase, partial [Bacteroidales bacterium]
MRNRYVLFADLPLIGIAAFGAFWLRFDWLFLRHRPEFLPFLLAVLLIKPTIFYFFGMYRRYWLYAGAGDMPAVALAVSAASVVVAAYVGFGRVLGVVGDFSRQAVAIDWLLTLVLAGGMRMSIRVIGDARQRAHKANRNGGTKRVLVAGAGEAGTLVVREMQKNPQLHLQPVGFLDDEPAKQSKSICGVTVLGPLSKIDEVFAAHRVDQVVIAMPTASGTIVRSLSESCRRLGVESRTVPGVFELLDGRVSVSRLRQVDIADLLRRSQIVGSPGASTYITSRTVLVTGAGGSIGAELCRQVAHAGPCRLVLLGHGENSIYDIQVELKERYPRLETVAVIADIRARTRLNQVFAEHRPAIVFHAAAHKHVPLMEENPQEAISNNVFGTLNVVRAAQACCCERLVLI